MSSETDLEKQILATVVYYDIFDYPLTDFEIFLYLIKKNKLGIVNSELSKNFNKDQNNQSDNNNTQYFHNSQFTIHNSLDTSKYLKKYLDQKYGFYFLRGKERIVRQRLERNKIADRKWKKAKPIFKILQIVPFVKFIMVGGSLAMGNPKKESDIDLIIVAQKGRIWTARILVTLLTSILGVRRHGNITQDKICLNHYITDHSLRIPFESLYNAESYCHLISAYAKRKKDSFSLKKIGISDFQKSNQWIKKYVCQYPRVILGNWRSVKRNKLYSSVAKFFEIILSGKIGDLFEKYSGEWQTKRIKRAEAVRDVSLRNGRVAIDENQLEFHPNSHEARIIPEFNRRMEKLKLFEFAKQKDSGLS